jgi:hypothetical protein
MRRPRSGAHLIQRGEVWYYRRVVPKDVHVAFGCTEVVKSLNTTSKIEADRLEKRCDVEFEQRLRRARDEANPETRRALLASQIIEANPRSHAMAQWGLAYLPPEDREEIRALITPPYAALEPANCSQKLPSTQKSGNVAEPPSCRLSVNRPGSPPSNQSSW